MKNAQAELASNLQIGRGGAGRRWTTHIKSEGPRIKTIRN
jgi:hypothetical protein